MQKTNMKVNVKRQIHIFVMIHLAHLIEKHFIHRWVCEQKILDELDQLNTKGVKSVSQHEFNDGARCL